MKENIGDKELDHMNNPLDNMSDDEATAFMFGVCPTCDRSDSPIVNVPPTGEIYYGMCHTHRLRWRIGDIKTQETEGSLERWAANWVRIESYTEVDRLVPVFTWVGDRPDH